MVRMRRHRTRFEIARQARYLTFSCYRRLPLFNNDGVKAAFVDCVAATKSQHEFLLLGWVIMPEHVHLMIVPDMGRATVPVVLRSMKQSFSQQVIHRWESLNAPVLNRLIDPRGVRHFWQRGGGYDRNIYTDAELFEKIEYIHNNPVRRGLVSVPTDWAWSSARWYSGMRSGELAIDRL